MSTASETSETKKFKLENVAVWYKCRECNGCFHSLPVVEKHFVTHHQDKKFILPENLPAGAKDGRIYLKTSSQKKPNQIQRDFASLLEQTAAGVQKTSKIHAVTCEICRKRFNSQSVLNFHTKRQHQEACAAGLESSKPLQEISTANGNETHEKQASTDIQVVGKRRRILSTKAKAIAARAKTLKIKGKTIPRSNNRKLASNTTHSNFIVVNNGGKKYRGCTKCPFHTRMGDWGHFERHAMVHEEGSKAVPCDRCGWYVKSTALGSHIFNRHHRTYKKKCKKLEKKVK